MKFGGSSLADASRIRAAAEIVSARLDRRPVVVVSALGGVTDLLERLLGHARRGRLEESEPLLADLERRHRWALGGGVENASRRHDLSLEVDAQFEDLRERLRSIRILGEGTPRACDAVMAIGERLAAKIVAACFADAGLSARELDARQVLVTDGRFGAAEPDLERTTRQLTDRVLPILSNEEVPVLGGFVGATAAGETTTLGRGGSDTSAAVLGCVGGAEEIQIWTDVDGLMTADPRVVPTARTLPEVSFAEAAELAFYGARVLHPASVAPAVGRSIPVRVLNSLRPEGSGTLVRDGGPGAEGRRLAAVASRGAICTVRLRNRRMRADPGFLSRSIAMLQQLGLEPDLVVSSEVGLAAAVADCDAVSDLERNAPPDVDVELGRDRGLLCVVGAGLVDEECRGRVIRALGEYGPQLVALGGSETSLTAVVEQRRLETSVRDLHRRFFEEEDSGE